MKPKWHWTNQPKAKYREALRGMSKGWGRKPRTGKTLKCPICGKRFYLRPSLIKRAKINYCSKECFSKSKKGKTPKNLKIAQKNSPIKPGKENINWKGGITPYPKEWTSSLHYKVWRRDNNQCQLCGKKGKKRSDLICHHIDFDKNNCSMCNLQLLCRSCHMKIHWRVNKGVPGLKKHNRILLRASR